MKRILLASIALAAFASSAAHSQNIKIVPACNAETLTTSPPLGQVQYMDPAGNVCMRTVSIPSTSGGLSVKSMLVANNTTSVAVDASPGQAYGFEAFNNTAVIAYLKLYNAAQGSTTCGSGTPVYRGMIPASTSGAGYVSNIPSGIAFSTAITACITTGIADNDTGAPAASGYIVNVFFK